MGETYVPAGQKSAQIHALREYGLPISCLLISKTKTISSTFVRISGHTAMQCQGWLLPLKTFKYMVTK